MSVFRFHRPLLLYFLMARLKCPPGIEYKVDIFNERKELVYNFLSHRISMEETIIGTDKCENESMVLLEIKCHSSDFRLLIYKKINAVTRLKIKLNDKWYIMPWSNLVLLPCTVHAILGKLYYLPIRFETEQLQALSRQGKQPST